MSKFLYKQVRSAGNSKQKLTLHKEWTITDETSASFGVYSYEGQHSNGSFNISDPNDTNVANEPFTIGSGNSANLYYKRTIWDSIYHIYYSDPENATISGDPQYFKQQTRNINREIQIVSIPSQIFGDRILEGSVTMSLPNTTINDDGQGNLIDKSILSSLSESVAFHTASKDDYHIKIDFNDGWKLQKGNLSVDQSIYTNRNIQLEDISNGPFEPYGENITFGWNGLLSGAQYNGLSGSSYIKLHGSQSIETGSNSFVEIAGSGQLNNNQQAWNDNFTVSMMVKLPVSQSVTSSFTGGWVNTGDGNQKRLLKSHPYNVLATSRKYSSIVPWEISVRNHDSDNNGHIYFERGFAGGLVQLTSSYALNDDAWHNVTILKQGSELKLFVDGTENKVLTDPVFDNNVCTRNDNIFIGTRPWDKKLRRVISQELDTGNDTTQTIRYKDYGDNYIYPATADINLFRIFNKELSSAAIASLNTYNRDSAIVGNIFYNNGIMCITDLSGSYDKVAGVGSDWTLNFKNSYPITVHNYKCVVEDGEYNVTLNPTARTKNDINNPKLKGFATASDFSPYITTIGLYNDTNELLAIGKLAYPVRSPQEIDITFNVQFDT